MRGMSRSAAPGANPESTMNTPPYRYTPTADNDGHHDVAMELSARRTGMSFQRTRMSTDRTLMSVMRTSVSLISFGFTIGQFFEHLRSADILAKESMAPRNFGVALVGLGIAPDRLRTVSYGELLLKCMDTGKVDRIGLRKQIFAICPLVPA